MYQVKGLRCSIRRPVSKLGWPAQLYIKCMDWPPSQQANLYNIKAGWLDAKIYNRVSSSHLFQCASECLYRAGSMMGKSIVQLSPTRLMM